MLNFKELRIAFHFIKSFSKRVIVLKHHLYFNSLKIVFLETVLPVSIEYIKLPGMKSLICSYLIIDNIAIKFFGKLRENYTALIDWINHWSIDNENKKIWLFFYLLVLQLAFLSLAKLAIFTTNVNAENQCLNCYKRV